MHPRSVLQVVVIALTVVVTNVVLCAVWTALAWGLRGVSYEEGRPTAEDELSVSIGWALLAVALVIHLVIPVAGAVARRWVVPIGVALGAGATPLALAGTIAALAAYAHLP